LGHEGGDAILKMVGQRLAGSLCRPGGVAARFGGDEFILLIPHAGEAEGLKKIVSDIMTVFDKP
jgi:diguanylate cyclase (GGDEF)-like protein